MRWCAHLLLPGKHGGVGSQERGGDWILGKDVERNRFQPSNLSAVTPQLDESL